jgi:hypothetical protein
MESQKAQRKASLMEFQLAPCLDFLKGREKGQRKVGLMALDCLMGKQKGQKKAVLKVDLRAFEMGRLMVTLLASDV